MTNEQILIANNQLLTAIAEKLGIEVELVSPTVASSIGGGGIYRPKPQN